MVVAPLSTVRRILRLSPLAPDSGSQPAAPEIAPGADLPPAEFTMYGSLAHPEILVPSCCSQRMSLAPPIQSRMVLLA